MVSYELPTDEERRHQGTVFTSVWCRNTDYDDDDDDFGWAPSESDEAIKEKIDKCGTNVNRFKRYGVVGYAFISVKL